MMCHAHVDGMCPRGARCNSSHSLLDPGSITTLVAHYGYPGQPFTVTYAPISEATSTREWQMSMTARDSSVGAPKPWRDLCVAHADFHGALRLLQYNVALSAPQLPARNIPGHSDDASISPMASASEVSLACPSPKILRYSPQLYDAVPGDLPWTAWEMLYWLAHGRPPKSRQNRLDATYKLDLPPPSPASKPDVWDELDGSDILATMPYAGQIAASLAQRAAQRFLAWRARAPAGERELNRAILNAFKHIDRFVPHAEPPAAPSGAESIGSAVLTGVVAPVLLWFVDKWLLRGAAYAAVRLAAWAFFACVYPPVVPCALVAWATRSTLLTSLALCGLHPAASFHVFLNFITGGVVYSLLAALAPLPVAFYIYFAVLRALGQPLYMVVFMRGLQRAA
ncbi:hypothetical protein PsYK624_057250 [Phanerochaete sordida]|uniref:C3H1-type domain-containing protein n=1 Tax=Phanerochaete sordida TaxID=48140 RepID=A0A9P3LBM1_9APHY|nr:hypothetical protein PsYK624_057250 [Phanerochaete sordida]